ncbi:hypothetical protein L2E82_37104 [Cichorium intybus]|uniref:Uncharacterized protein n=1 Tax=Cichorium intybus TaxID=13427 RepID=A0ACB9AI11_CICIN|nr:hypothetical protein L2E82_37104 [Cichorium intybus]
MRCMPDICTGAELPSTQLTSIAGPWLFHQWGIDIVGPFPEAPGKVKFLIIAVDYFTKWIEAEPVANISRRSIIKFMWKSILTRFGTPRTLANGQTEVSNKIIVNGQKKRLGKAKGNWVEELPSVLWSYRTTPITGTQETPFSLVYGAEAILPPELMLTSLRIANFSPEQTDADLRQNLDLLEEKGKPPSYDKQSSRTRLKNTTTSENNRREGNPKDMVHTKLEKIPSLRKPARQMDFACLQLAWRPQWPSCPLQDFVCLYWPGAPSSPAAPYRTSCSFNWHGAPSGPAAPYKTSCAFNWPGAPSGPAALYRTSCAPSGPAAPHRTSCAFKWPGAPSGPAALRRTSCAFNWPGAPGGLAAPYRTTCAFKTAWRPR